MSCRARLAQQVPGATIPPGTWKYVLLKATDASGQTKLLVRSYEGVGYHAEVAERNRRESTGWVLSHLSQRHTEETAMRRLQRERQSIEWIHTEETAMRRLRRESGNALNGFAS